MDFFGATGVGFGRVLLDGGICCIMFGCIVS